MRILIAEDDMVTKRLLEARLNAWGYDVITAADGNDAWKALSSEDPPGIAIIDWMMPGIDGVELCRRVRGELKETYIYIILLTSQHRDEDLIIGMEAGADDYIIKPFKPNELKVRLRAGIRIIELQNELVAAREALREKATHDSLTGLWNHEEIIDILEKQIARAKREDGHVAAIMADIDLFKRINDTHGHTDGDTVLRMTAQRILGQIRSYDSIGRYGGEEFLIVMPGCKKEDLVDNAERIRLCVGLNKMDVSGKMIPVTISIGAVSWDTEDIPDALAMIKAADTALYRAKGNGRNRVEIA